MRLTKIKLAGFKSFVDPTIVSLQSNLTAIVGPNGCGKSNIVDAIRWVIGESSAKQLRGESLIDVIFNGTTHRKPVGKASIELIFDNTQGRLGAAYASYQEISIKREITRDGQSQFYLNGVKCRKRDITDLFLGTGLGPSSYAIIEQGVVSQLIESKPEELRIHFEEAAGISKYRERRKETETRIRNTRENLERLTDLREEIEKQLERLKRQASAAERFKVLKKEQRLLKAQLHTLQHQFLSQQIFQQNQQLGSQTTLLEEKIAEQRNMELNIEQTRVQQTHANEQFNLVQENFYSLGTNIATKEQQIRNIRQNTEQLCIDLEKLEHALQDTQKHQEEDTAQIEGLTSDLTSLVPHVEKAQETAHQAQALLEQAEISQREWQGQWDEFQKSMANAEQKTTLGITRKQHLHQKLQEIEARTARLQQEQQTLSVSTLAEEIDHLSTQSITCKKELDALHEAIAKTNSDIQLQRQKNTQSQQEHDQTKQALQKLNHQKISLDALQQAAIKKHDAGTDQWLKDQGWSEKPRLIDSLETEAGWEIATETALSPYLEAICTDTAEDFNIVVNQITTGRLALVNIHAPKTTAQHNKAETLISKVREPSAAHNLLQGIYVAEDILSALNLLPKLSPEESVMTRDGVWLSPCWVRINKVQDEMAGVVQRKQQLKEIAQQIDAQEKTLAAKHEAWQEGLELLHQTEETRDQQQHTFREVSSTHSELRSKLSAKQAEIDQIQKRSILLTQDLDEQTQQLTDTQNQLETIEQSTEEAQKDLELYAQQKITLLQTQDAAKAKLTSLQENARTHRKMADEQKVNLSSMQNQLHYLRQNTERTKKQLNQLTEQRASLQERKDMLIAPLPELEDDLQELLQNRLEVEKALNLSREAVTQSTQTLEQSEKQRAQIEQYAQTIRASLEKIRIEQSTIKTRLENHLEQIQETGHVLEDLEKDMPEDASEKLWQEKVSEVDQKIQRLGPINLAAIEEYEELLARKNYLDSQDKDLNEALNTLESTIQKIDRESRARLKETFEQANAHFKTLFTKMFNGGNAELEFTGDEVLTAGVIIRAQPPGKRNSQLYLLSGGEKALTAIALVFALFQLNPAPFCVLDEVDAPLDDANVARFCRLVEAMSSTVQFLFISHNKVTMEMAKQLIGVTMHEPGASRLVSVDIDQAIAMTETIGGNI